jgi:hypothetical protein
LGWQGDKNGPAAGQPETKAGPHVIFSYSSTCVYIDRSSEWLNNFLQHNSDRLRLSYRNDELPGLFKLRLN